MQILRPTIGLFLLLAACASGGGGQRTPSAPASPGDVGRARAIAERARLGPGGPAVAHVWSEQARSAHGTCVAFSSPVVDVSTAMLGLVDVQDGAALVRTVSVRQVAWTVSVDDTYLSPAPGQPAPGAGQPAVYLRRGAVVDVLSRDRDWIQVELAEAAESARGWIPAAAATQVGPGRDEAVAIGVKGERVWPLAGQLRARFDGSGPPVLTTFTSGPFAVVQRTEAGALAAYQSSAVRALGFITHSESEDYMPAGRDLHHCAMGPPPRRNLPVVNVFLGAERAEVDVPAGVCLRSELDGTVVGITLEPARRTVVRRDGSSWATAWFLGGNFPPAEVLLPTRPGPGPVRIVADCSASLVGRRP